MHTEYKKKILHRLDKLLKHYLLKDPGMAITGLQPNAMASTASYFLHPYAQQLALHALQRIQGAQITFILQYKDPEEVIQVGDTGGSPQSDSTVVLRVRSPNVWMRICSCFDLVRFTWSKKVSIQWYL